MIFFRTPSLLPWLFPDLTWREPSEAKELYLTFDDGPVPGPTEFALDELKKANAQATFFCIGNNVNKNPDLFKKVLAGGHTIGNHTYNHVSGWGTKNSDYLENIDECNRELNRYAPVTGNCLPAEAASAKAWQPAAHQPESSNQQPAASSQQPVPSLFRPPYGRITRSQIRLLERYKLIMWDVLSHDYARSLSPGRCLKGSIAATRPGSIIVFHDSYKAEKNMTYVLPRFISHFAGAGFTFKSLH